jgi:type VI secretion system protein VasG
MERMSVKFLVEKLNRTCTKSLEAAAALCLSRTNYNLEIEHWLLKLLELPNADGQAILRHYDLDSSRLLRDLNRTIDGFDRGNGRTPPLSPQLFDLVREAWLTGSMKFNAVQIRSGFIFLALRSDETLARLASAASPEFDKIPAEALEHDLLTITANTEESAAGPPMAGASKTPPGQAALTGTQALDQFTIDLTDRARTGKIDPVLGRDAEIRQIIDILSRRRQNNPILTGEAGVGKTAVVEGFALRVAAGDVPPSLKEVVLRSLDLGLLQAGAGIKGEFENRLKSVIEEVKASPKPIVLFIDEAHTMVGAGGAAGQNDAANLLKPALARGELRTIAATTWAEYKKYFEQDAALARRFQVVKVEEPSEEAAVEMLRGLVETLEHHHNVRILNEGLVAAVRLSHRYISGRQLPDKAVGLLDTACARVGLSHTSIPAAVEDCRRRVQQLGVSLDILDREISTGTNHQKQFDALASAKKQAEDELTTLNSRWQEELRLVREIRRLRDQLAGTAKLAPQALGPVAGPPSKGDASATGNNAVAPDKPALPGKNPPEPPNVTPEEKARLRCELANLSAELAKVQADHPMVHICVDSPAVAQIVAAWTGIPVGRMVKDEISAVLCLKENLERRIIGQSHALEVLAKYISTARSDLADPRRPIGVFLLVGPSGVGKTETAISLAELLYGGDQNMTVINMSEFKEEHKVSLLMGSPPGYVGYREGGVLTEAVRRKPYSVVLLDEMEKAHPDVHDIFYQVFDKGTLRDGEGREINFKNTVIIMTSNAGTELITKLCADPETRPDPAKLTQLLHPELLKTFRPAFLGRTTVVPYYTLPDEFMRRIVELQLARIGQRVRQNHNASFDYAPELIQGIAARCTEVDAGARNIDHILSGTLLPQLSARFLARLAAGQPITAVRISLDPTGGFQYEIN